MEKVKMKHLYFDKDVVLRRTNCIDCSSFRRHPATQFDPPEEICLDGDFGDRPCEKILSVLEYLIDAGELQNDSGYIIYCGDCNNEDELEPKEGWNAHTWWWVFYDGNNPIGMDALEEVFRECFS